MGRRHAHSRNRRGSSVVEISLLLPWICFLFVGAFDWGFYAHALISVESAARVASVYGAGAASGQVSQSEACTLVLDELKIVANVQGLASCTGTLSATQPVILTVTCPAPTSSLDSLNYVQVAVQYQTVNLIPIPGILPGTTTLYRVAAMPMKGNHTCTVVS